ncbi:MAG: hypothetical protein GF408_06810 [Candidatus Omnitrophica bacterium]|nr:hypothetical protein [Candidatus Omnitrophota bacterium]
MDINMASAGLVLIMAAWFIQLVFSLKGNFRIQPAFIVCYMAGVLLMIVSDYLATSVLSYFEALTFIASGIVLARILTAQESA